MPFAPAPRVSILVRTKDRPLMLARALDDVLAQTFGEWELIVVNDGGEAAPVDALVAERSEKLGDRASVLHHAASLGMEAASNAALARATGEYVVVHDDDDTWAPAFLSTTVSHLDTHSGVVAVAARTEIVIEKVDGDDIIELGRQPFGPPHDVVTLLDMLLINRVVPIGLLSRTETVRAIGGYDETLPVVGDWEFNLRLVRAGQVDFLPDAPLAFWHQRPDGKGVLANSMAGAYGAHARYDRLVRERALRADLESGGTGQLMYLAMLIDEVVRGAERRIIADQRRAIEESERRIIEGLRDTIRTYSPAATARRAVGRMLRRSR